MTQLLVKIWSPFFLKHKSTMINFFFNFTSLINEELLMTCIKPT